MRIGELSRRTGVPERLLRYYEEQGLLRPARRASGYREYEDGDVTTVSQIRTLLAAGLSTTVIAKVLPCMEPDDGWLSLVASCPEILTEFAAERDRISRTIEDLETARAILDAIIATGPRQEIRPHDGSYERTS